MKTWIEDVLSKRQAELKKIRAKFRPERHKRDAQDRREWLEAKAAKELELEAEIERLKHEWAAARQMAKFAETKRQKIAKRQAARKANGAASREEKRQQVLVQITENAIEFEKKRHRMQRVITPDGRMACRTCAQVLPLTEFYVHVSKKGHKNYDSNCNTCRKAKMIGRRHGMSGQQVTALISARLCDICGEGPAPDSERQRLHIDHSHTTGEVRGVLCVRCNSAIGMFRERPDLLLSAIEYLKRYQPAALPAQAG